MSNTLSIEDANELVLEHRGWAISIAKSVAKAWSVNWEMDGLDGAAMEALIFCSRRFDPERKIPFKGYARRRIHEASCEAARKSKGWNKEEVATKRTERLARQVSADLFNLFPQLRSGNLPFFEGEDSEQQTRVALKQLLIGASLISTKYGVASESPDDVTEYKRVAILLSSMEPIHQDLIWKVYWDGESLRGVAGQWDVDPLNVIREHQVLIDFIQKIYKAGAKSSIPRVRPGLKEFAMKLERNKSKGAFTDLINRGK